MFFNKKYVILFFLIHSFIFAQNNGEETSKKEPEVFNLVQLTEENIQHFLEGKDLVLIYFYSKSNPDSLKMKESIKKIKIEGSPSVFTVNLETNQGLRQSFKIQDLPSLVILKKRKLIYGLTGYIDDPEVLSEFINNGIKDNLYE
ncbi:MAG: hypothetical protein A2Y41_10490 [Spirochaetes bacterium GWB1_36_13]|nr:MAG: hypothetical protein A2Y41_10490 [Spirochaetes bacterium GWB1_36_13]